MKVWIELALLHECGHAWLILEMAERPVTLHIPHPDSGEDARCEWDAGSARPAAALLMTMGGLAAELLANGVPEHLARQNAEGDLAGLAALGLSDEDVQAVLGEAMGQLEDDAEAFGEFYYGIRDKLVEHGLPFVWRGEPKRWWQRLADAIRGRVFRILRFSS